MILISRIHSIFLYVPLTDHVMLRLARQTPPKKRRMTCFTIVEKKTTFFEAIYFFISSLRRREGKRKRNQETKTNVNSVNRRVTLTGQLCTLDTRHICILTIKTCNPVTRLALNHASIMECSVARSSSPVSGNTTVSLVFFPFALLFFFFICPQRSN